MIAVARGKGSSRPEPTGAVLWAMVSADVDRKLSTQLDQSVRLQPGEWKSGSIVWIISAVGTPKIIEGLMRKLVEGPFKGRMIKMRGRAPDGKAKVVSIDTNQKRVIS